jgi:hypothetical protein
VATLSVLVWLAAQIVSAVPVLPAARIVLAALISALPAPGYWILTATWRPSCQTPRCTWPIEAAAAGWSSNSAKLARHSSPMSAASTL